MKKSIVFVTYSFKPMIGFDVVTKSKIVSVMHNGELSNSYSRVRQIACEAVAREFQKAHPDWEMISVQAETPLIVNAPDFEKAQSGEPHVITAEQARAMKLDLPDAYDANLLDAGQVLQLIGETGPYTDFLFLKNQLSSGKIEVVEAAGCYVNSVQNLDKKNGGEFYTLIRWDDRKPVNNSNASFEAVTRPVIKYLCENHHPHVSVIITPTDAQLVEGLQSTGQIMDYVRD